MNIDEPKVSEGMTFYLDGLVGTIKTIYRAFNRDFFGDVHEVQMAKVVYTYGKEEHRPLNTIYAHHRQVDGKTHTHYRERVFADGTRTVERKSDGVIVAYYINGWMARRDAAFEGASDDETLELMRICIDE